MPKDQISLRQLLMLLFAALLSPMIQVLPRETVMLAGKAGWLSALAALPVVLLLAWAFQTAPGKLGDGCGMAEGLEAAFGPWIARGLVVLYLVWGVLLLGWNTRWCAYRALSVNYRNAPMPLFILALLVLTLWLGHKSLSAFSRAGEIFALALGGALLLALVLATLRTEWNNVGPIWVEDLPGAVGGVLPVLGLADGQKLETIPGATPNPADLKGGCEFADRCPFCTDQCRAKDIPMFEVAPGHRVRCLKFQEYPEVL